jgi:hypothetical protein
MRSTPDWREEVDVRRFLVRGSQSANLSFALSQRFLIWEIRLLARSARLASLPLTTHLNSLSCKCNLESPLPVHTTPTVVCSTPPPATPLLATVGTRRRRRSSSSSPFRPER